MDTLKKQKGFEHGTGCTGRKLGFKTGDMSWGEEKRVSDHCWKVAIL